MEYNLYINQRAVYEFGLQEKLDAIDLLLFDYVYHFMNSTKAIRTKIDGCEYVMIRHTLISEECPILGINHRDTFRKRMLKLVGAGLLKRCESNQEVGNSLYSRGENFCVFVSDSKKSDTLPTTIGTAADDELHKHNTIEHNIPLNNPTLFNNKDSLIIPPEGKAKKSTHFVRPTLEEVEAYCKERNNGIDAQYFLDYQEARGWLMRGKTPIKNWKAAVRTWERNNPKDDRPFEKRRDEFYNKVNAFFPAYAKIYGTEKARDILGDFYQYWKESGDGVTMRFEKEKIFEIESRLQRYVNALKYKH
jgi:hypothetical protein